MFPPRSPVLGGVVVSCSVHVHLFFGRLERGGVCVGVAVACLDIIGANLMHSMMNKEMGMGCCCDESLTNIGTNCKRW